MSFVSRFSFLVSVETCFIYFCFSFKQLATRNKWLETIHFWVVLTWSLPTPLPMYHTCFNSLDSTISQSIAIVVLKFLNNCPKQDLNLGQSRIAVFEDYKATALTTQPSQLDKLFNQLSGFRSICLFVSWKWLDTKLIFSRLTQKQPFKWSLRFEKVVSTISAWNWS